MILDWLLELKNNINEHGIRWGLALTLFALYRKERRNFRLDQRDADAFHNQRVIMEKLGCEDQWRGQASPFQSEEVRSLKRLYSSLRQESQRVNRLRRRRRMNQNINLFTLLGGILSALKLILQPFGIDIPDEHINALVNGAASLMVIIGVIYNHFKPRLNGGALNANTKSSNTIESNK